MDIASLNVPQDWHGKKLKLKTSAAGQYTLYSPGGETLIHGQVGQAASADLAGDATAITVAHLDARPGTAFTIVKQPALRVYTALNAGLSVVEQGRDTGVLLMTLEGHNPTAIAATLNAIANAYVAESARLEALQATKSLQFVSQQLPLLQNQTNEAQAALSAYETRQGRVEMSLEAKAMLDQAAQVQEQLTKISLQNAQLSQQFTPDYPAIQALDQQRASLLAQKAKVEAAIRSLPQTQQQLVALTRDAKVANDVYSYLLGKSEEFKIQQAGSIGNARIIDLAVPPIKPVKPKKAQVAAITLILGLFLGAFFVLVRRYFMSGVSDPDILERHLGRPVYAVIPHSRFQARFANRQVMERGAPLPVLAVAEPQDMAIEALRSLRTSLNFALGGARNRVISLGGPRPGVGKSFVTINLAHVFADADKQVLVMDADLRRGHLHQYFSVPRQPGLSQILSGEFQLDHCLVRSKTHSNITLLPTGMLPPNPSELLMSERFGKLLDEFASCADLVLIDLPPYLAVADGLTVAAYAATNLVVLHAGVHPLREIEHVAGRLRQSNVTISGFVLNDMSPRSAAYGYRKYGYAYSYQYSKKRS